MKRIIKGSTYNTETSKPFALYYYTDELDQKVEAKLYVNRNGAYFCAYTVVDTTERPVFEALDRSELDRIFSTNEDIEILDTSIIGHPPEAVATPVVTAT